VEKEVVVVWRFGDWEREKFQTPGKSDATGSLPFPLLTDRTRIHVFGTRCAVLSLLSLPHANAPKRASAHCSLHSAFKAARRTPVLNIDSAAQQSDPPDRPFDLFGDSI
jgi:hypothetical protein